jgi:adenosine deaminase
MADAVSAPCREEFYGGLTLLHGLSWRSVDQMGDAMNYDTFLRRLPKAELHVHFIGAVRPATLIELARKNQVALPTEDPALLYEYDNIFDFLRVFDLVALSIVDREDFARVAYETLEDGVKLGNLKYREMFFNPSSHTMEGIPYPTVVDGIIDGMQAAERDFGVQCRLVAAIHRGHSPVVALAMVEDLIAIRRDLVIGVGSDALPADGSEGLQLFTEAYALAKRHGLKISAHCAELPGTAANFTYALDILKCDRIDHGYRILDNPALVARAKAENIWFTCAPTSTAQVYGWPDLSQHPIRAMVEHGLNVTLGSDDPPMFKTDIGREFAVTCQAMEFSPDTACRLALNGIDGSWMDVSEKRSLHRIFAAEIAELKSQLDYDG